MGSRRWYLSGELRRDRTTGYPVQKELLHRRESLYLAPEVIQMAYDEYAAQGFRDQSLERLNERAGFGILELVALLADALERERGGPDA